MRILFSLFYLYLPALVLCQEVRFVKDLTWEQVKEKAKIEKKFIFLDCYTTWCGPCKEMEKKVYVNDTVGSYFNQHFLSVKVQMDKTDNDDHYIQQWYDEAAAMLKRYRVTAFPTFIFLSPEGDIVHKDIGYKSARRICQNRQHCPGTGQGIY